MAIFLNSKCLSIIHAIVDSNGSITIDDISKALNISKRSVYYSLNSINETLKNNGIEEITSIRNKGVTVTTRLRTKLETIIKETQGVPVSLYVMSTVERLSLIICCIYINSSYYNIEKLAEVSYVSKSTIQKDLKNIRKILSEYDLKLCYSVNNGFYISGNTFIVRAIFLYYLNKVYYLIYDRKVPLDWIVKSKRHLKKLQLIEKELSIQYVNNTIEKLSILIEYQKNDLKPEDLKFDTVAFNSKEYELVNKCFSHLSYIEKQYVTLYLKSGRPQIINEYKTSNAEFPSIRQLAIKMVDKFEKIVCVEFDNKDKLVTNITYHIICSLNRYKYGWLEVNELTDEIMERYPEYFYFSELVVNSLKNEFSYPITNDEIAYFVLHFGAHIRRYGYKKHKLRVVLVCPNGISTTSMLVREIEELALDLEILDVVSKDKIKDYSKDFDLIVSTVNITSKTPVVKVHPVLTSSDKNNIISYINNQSDKNNINSDLLRLMNKLDKYILKSKKADVQEILLNYLKYKVSSMHKTMSTGLIGLKQLLNKDVITICDDELTWEKAVALCGIPLLQSNDILIDYINKTIHYIKQDGPYSVFPNNMFIAHAKCEDGVNNLSVSILISNKDVLFTNEVNIKFIILLATPDNKCHLRVLNELVEIFSDNKFVEEITKLTSIDKIYTLIQSYQFKSYTAMEE